MSKIENRAIGLLAALLICGPVAASANEGSAPPQPISPGSSDETPILESGCATFSWAGVPRAGRYELAIWQLPEPRGATAFDPWRGRVKPMMRVLLPGTAASWSPPHGSCPPAGASYAWSIRDRRNRDWSEPLFFEIPLGPTRVEIAGLLQRLAGRPTRRPPPVTTVPTNLAEPLEAGQGRPLADEATPPPAPLGEPFSSPAPATPLLPAADATAIRAELSDPSGITFGAHALSASPVAGSAGLVGEATGAGGVGLTAACAGPSCIAGLLENTGGGDVVLGVAGDVEVFRADSTGTVTAAAFSGNGSQLLGAAASLHCVNCVQSDEIQVNAILGSHIAPGGVLVRHIVDGAVGATALAPNSIDTAELAPNAVTSTGLAAGAVTRSKISGTEIALYDEHDDCDNPGAPTTDATCPSVEGNCPAGQFQNCSGACVGSSQTCSNDHRGYLLSPSIP